MTHYNGKGEAVRTVHKRRLIMPAKVEAADGIRKMLGWDKRPDDQPQDDITELLVMIRRRSGAQMYSKHLKRMMPTLCPKKPKAHKGSRHCLVSHWSHPSVNASEEGT